MDNEGSSLRQFLVSRVTLDMAPLLMIQITIAVLVSWPLLSVLSGVFSAVLLKHMQSLVPWTKLKLLQRYARFYLWKASLWIQIQAEWNEWETTLSSGFQFLWQWARACILLVSFDNYFPRVARRANLGWVAGYHDQTDTQALDFCRNL